MHRNPFEEEYGRFEDRFRGSKDLIKQRLSVYLPLIADIKLRLAGTARAIDIGSGRGEWLELLTELGWRVTGVEPNDIAEATAGAAEIVRMDALGYLSKCEDDCYAVVTAFHVVEHLEMGYLLQLLREIRRVLIPGGLVILETPNPENLTVGWSFYVDPTHKAPLPPVLLQYHVERAGFPAPEIVRLNGYEEDYDFGPASALLSTLFRSGPDYAIVGRSPAGTDDLSALKLRDFAIAHSQRDPTDMRTLVQLAMRLDNNASQHAAQLAQLRSDCSHLQATVSELSTIYRSTSWRITRPLRWCASFVRGLVRTARSTARSAFLDLRLSVRRHPSVKARAIGWLRLLPRLKQALIQLTEEKPLAWSTETDQETVDAWAAILHSKER